MSPCDSVPVRSSTRRQRGFHTFYPIKRVRPAATVITTYADPAARYTNEGGIAVEQPYLATLRCGKGRCVYLSAGEMWRLRLRSEDYYNHFWTGLLRYAGSGKPIQASKASELLPELIPAHAADLAQPVLSGSARR